MGEKSPRLLGHLENMGADMYLTGRRRIRGFHLGGQVGLAGVCVTAILYAIQTTAIYLVISKPSDLPSSKDSWYRLLCAIFSEFKSLSSFYYLGFGRVQGSWSWFEVRHRMPRTREALFRPVMCYLT